VEVAFAILILKRRDLTLYPFDPTHARCGLKLDVPAFAGQSGPMKS
jgi:hypothetical protein